jgi:hypothetical protein
MTVSGEQKLIPQTDEDIFDIKWIGPRDVTSYLANSFPLIVDVIRAAKQTAFISL